MSAEASLVSHVVPNQSSFFPGEAFRGTWEVLVFLAMLFGGDLQVVVAGSLNASRHQRIDLSSHPYTVFAPYSV